MFPEKRKYLEGKENEQKKDCFIFYNKKETDPYETGKANRSILV